MNTATAAPLPSALLLGLLAETPIHYGADTGAGAIDLPVAREAATLHPVIAGSAFKGAFKDIFGKVKDSEGKDTDQYSEFTGNPDQAGHLIFSDLRLLLLPVRSLSLSYAWVTCPLLLERWQRDTSRGGSAIEVSIPKVSPGHYLSLNPALPPFLQLEELQFTRSAGTATGEQALTTALLDALKTLIPHPAARGRLADQLVVLHDQDFAWFAQFGLPVNAHNQLDENKTSKNLWYEETLAPDTLMYGLILPRPTLPPPTQKAAMERVRAELGNRAYLQIGAGETTGLGWFAHNHPATPGTAA